MEDTESELVMQCISEWGGNPEKHVEASRALLDGLKETGYRASLTELRAEVEIWQGEKDYDHILEEEIG